MSSVASPDQPAAPLEPDHPFPMFLNGWYPFGYTASKFGSGSSGKNASWNAWRSAAAVGLP